MTGTTTKNRTKPPILWLAGVSALALAGSADTSRAQSVTITGDVSPSPASSPNWTVGGDLRIAASPSSNGTLSVAAGGTVGNANGFIGTGTGSTGTATVTGGGSVWTNSGTLDVGFDGTGTLTISSGGVVANTSASIGSSLWTGTVIVTGGGSRWSNSDSLTVGRSSGGVLTIGDGGAVTNTIGIIGGGAGSAATVTVTGGGSTWTNSGSLTVGRSGNGTLTVENSGAVANTNGIIGNTLGTGMVTISGGGSTWTNSGSLQLDNGTLIVEGAGAVSNTDGTIGTSSSGTGAVTVTGGGSTWTNSGRLTVGASGNGTLTVAGGGAVSNTDGFIGDSPFGQGAGTVTGGGSTWINSGTLTVGASGNGTLTIAAGGAVSNTDGTIAAGPGSIGAATVSGGGSAWTNNGRLTVGLFGNGTLTIAASGTVSSANGLIGFDIGSVGTAMVTGSGSTWTNGGALNIGLFGNGGLTVAAGGAVSNTDGSIGGLTTIGTMTTGSTGAATVTGNGSTWTNSGTLTVGASGNGTLSVEAGGAVSDTDGVIGAVSGSTGIATVTGTGSTWTNGTSLAIGSLGTGTLTLAGGGALSVGGGTGTIGVAALGGSTGTLVFGAAAGSTAVSAGTVSAGTLAFGAGAGTLVFNHAGTPDGAALTFAPTITGSGTIEQIAGTTVLTGTNTATAAFTGTTTVSGGRLVVNGTFGDLDPAGGLNQALIDVSGGGVLGGSGRIAGSVTIASGSTLAPGNSPGTLNVGGDLTVSNGAIYEVETVTGTAVSDRIAVAGTATLNGGDVRHVSLDDVYDPRQTFTILTADGGVVGRFASVSSRNFLFLALSLVYLPTEVRLRLDRNDVSFASIARTPNEGAAASGLDLLSLDNAAKRSVIDLADAATARLAFEQLSGEVHASVKTGRLEDARFARNTAIDRLEAAFAEPLVGATTSGPSEGAVLLGSTGVSAWISGYGSWGETDGNGNAASLDRDLGGFLVGADGMLTETLRIGLMAGYGEASFDAAGRGSANVDTTTVGIYAGTEFGALALKAGASYGFEQIDTSRSVAFGAFRDNLTARYDGGTAQVFGEAAYRFDVAAATAISPFANLAYVSLDTDGFTESGGAAALSARGDTADATFSTLGLRGSTALPLGDLALQANAMLGWRHAFGDTTPNAVLAFASGPAFAVSGVPLAEDLAVVEVGLGLAVAPNAKLGLNYAGQFGDGTTDNGVRASFELRF